MKKSETENGVLGILKELGNGLEVCLILICFFGIFMFLCGLAVLF